jgi:hypothetical protein
MPISQLPPETLSVLQEAMASAIHPIFWVGAAVAILAFFAALMLPRERRANEACGEKMIMAEHTTINARNQPAADETA